jgi:uncharacterized membrane protein YdjX (TVP38/TMEM64 family)
MLFGVQAVAYAYIGPGLGVGTIVVALGFVGSIFLALFAVLYYPIKKMLKRRGREKKTQKSENKKDEVKEEPTEN